MMMTYKQKLGYMALGAGIMAVGITIGQFITPNIEAQSNGVFDEIQCSKLTVIDELGKRAIELGKHGNDVLIYDRAGQIRIALGRIVSLDGMVSGYGIVVYSEEGWRSGNKIQLYAGKDDNSISVQRFEEAGVPEVSLFVDEAEGGIRLRDTAGNMKWITAGRD